ncbi:MAG TPA: thioredoxin domain-containing protein, partial [Nitrosopumilaceae archaeon]|nr:thioredoxin domain-containing protein [Nitrosopumilaceae archaeon]
MQANNLIKETSPYLLQHAYNPVKWYAWGEEALKKAKEENKPIFLSIGYSACHWCHVMAHESFENEEIAKTMNENFINIKVDREERPDLDEIYQKVCQLTTGSGGWPLSVFLTPDQKPFYVGTYFPVLDNYGRPGFGSLLRQLSQAYKEKPEDIEAAATNFMNAL